MSIVGFRKDKNCRVCGSSNFETVFRLKDTPIEDLFVASNNLVEQPLFPLEMALCRECSYLGLRDVVFLESCYQDYLYRTQVSVDLKNYYTDYAQSIASVFSVQPGRLAIDLGSNDGSLLFAFQSCGLKVLGVEPAQEIAKSVDLSGLETINDFFTFELSKKIVSNHEKAAVVTVNYCYANIDDIHDFTRGVSNVLSGDGIFIAQTGYFPDQMKLGMFDYIYHEHLSYFTVKVLSRLMKLHGLELIQVDRAPQKGGSIRIVAQKIGGSRKVSSSVDSMLQEEESSGVYGSEVYRDFFSRIQMASTEVNEKLQQLKNMGKKIVGFGASCSTTTLMYHFGLEKYLDFLVDDNFLKNETYSPGNHLPVYLTEKIYSDPPDYLLIMAWQHQDSIVRRHARLLSKGTKFLIPLPSMKLIERETN